ncbi:MAG: hypothetical protein H6Q70_1322 [Firmicutes bacterium]|nr:hypothetical protein [Bacillota bacterium]
MVFLLQGKKGDIYYTLREYYHNSRKTFKKKSDIDYAEDLKSFLLDENSICSVYL